MADASAKHGAGHVLRCLALAEQLDSRSHGISWLVSRDPIPWVVGTLRSRGWEIREFDVITRTFEESSKSTLFDVIVIDSYTLNPEEIAGLGSESQYRVAIVDDVTPAYWANLYVAPGLVSTWSVPNADAQILHGTQYVLIRESLRSLKRDEKEARQGDIVTLTCVMGGSDKVEAGPRLASILNQLSIPMHLNIVPDSARLRETISHLGPELSVSVLAPGERVFKSATMSDLVISSAGVSAWELLLLGVNLGIVQTADNQRVNFESMTHSGWAVALGVVPDWASIRTATIDWVRSWVSSDEPGPMASRGTDGRGAERVALAIERLVMGGSAET